MQTADKNIAILILAAGAATRMGKVKQLLSWGKTTLLGNAIEAALEVTDSVFVVLGAHAELIKKEIKHTVEYIENDDWPKGMGTSIATGVKHISSTKKVDAILIMLADQPFLGAHYLQELIKHYYLGGHMIIATDYGQKNGVPAIFDNRLFHELGQLNQDMGARELMKKYTTELKTLHPKESTIDVDTMTTYTNLRKEHNQKSDYDN